MPTVTQLKRDIARLRKRIEDRERLNRQDAAEILLYEEIIKRMEALTAGNQRGTVNRVTKSRRKALSEATIPEGGDEFLAALHAAGFASMRALAEKLGVTAAFLSRVRAGQRGVPKMPRMPAPMAEQIERLTGYKKSHWSR